MIEEYTPPQATKTIALDLGRFQIAEQKEHEFEYWVNKTAKLIDRPYFQTFTMVKKWSLEKIIRHYNLATKHNGDMPSNVYWWWARKANK